ncbi:MAG: hypothetical protein LBR93_01525 [Treponema sp.]|nr:hypothetical protein [Treponema sp.]
MNTIPTIFNAQTPSYTAVGGKERHASTGLSAVLMNRNGHYSRRAIFQDLEKNGFDYVISMERKGRYDVEELSGRFPFVRFILLPQDLSPGEQINLAACELSSPLFFVLWNDLKIITGGGAGRIAGRLCLSQEELKKTGGNTGACGRLCTVPVIQNTRCEILPTLTAPAVSRGNVKPLIFSPQKEGLPSLYPFDSVGVYDRERFIRLGGFDTTLKNPYWQLMDFGFRACLWGEEIRVTQQLKLSREGEFPVADNTPDESYRRFYLKNLALVFHSDYAHLPLRRFFGYLRRSGVDPFSAWEEFSQARRWVKINRYRFRSDARMVNELWEDIEAAQAAGP